jgi:FKBP-type peptidyl-prolyl cis-trans isomerase/predicted  nucleic acid-binding Zn-ribbon protein
LQSIKHYWHKALERLNRPSALPQARELERRLSSVRDENQALRLELTGIQEALDDNRNRKKEALAGLLQQIDHLQAERDAAREQMEGLQESLTGALSRQESTEQQLNHVQAQGDTTRQQVEALQGSLKDAASRQDRAEQLVSALNSELQKERRNNQTEQQAARIRARKQTQRTSAALLMAGLAFLLATATLMVEIRDIRKNTRLLADVSRDLKDIKFSMEQHLAGNLHAPPTGSPAAVSDKAADKQVLDPEDTAAGEDEGVAAGQPGPEYEFDQGQYLDRLQHNKKRTRDEMLAFFEENATREGVISMPSGLQYKVLRRGSGSSPEATDTVVIDYRVFLSDGTEIYNTYDQAEPATFHIKSFKPGLQQALLKMEGGSQWELYIPPALASHRGVRRRTGRTKYGYEPLIYVIELHSVIEADTATPR